MKEEDYEKDERGLPLQFYPDDPPIEKGVWMKLEIHVTPEEFDLLKQAQLEAARWEDVGLWLSEVQMILNRKLSPFTNYEIVVDKLQTRKIAAERAEGSMSKENRILNGMNLIAKYEPDADLSAEHDQIWFGTHDPANMTFIEQEDMKEWGWFEDAESWSHFC